MKIYTKTGDNGTTGLFNGQRVDKDNIRVESYGTIDELNTIIGIILCYENNQDIKDDLNNIQLKLFVAGTDLATPFNPPPKWEIKRIQKEDYLWIEQRIDYYTLKMPDLKNFILPGGSIASSFIHQARAVSRRAERNIISLAKAEEINKELIIYINRLSDYFFTIARYSNFSSGIDDIIVK